eukprot:Rhum_TRINITY_DN23480_c0_g1::Rhum_TRINITY_DN23480_c0_g1_i1::g.178097::m.178097
MLRPAIFVWTVKGLEEWRDGCWSEEGEWADNCGMTICPVQSWSGWSGETGKGGGRRYASRVEHVVVSRAVQKDCLHVALLGEAVRVARRSRGQVEVLDQHRNLEHVGEGDDRDLLELRAHGLNGRLAVGGHVDVQEGFKENGVLLQVVRGCEAAVVRGVVRLASLEAVVQRRRRVRPHLARLDVREQLVQHVVEVLKVLAQPREQRRLQLVHLLQDGGGRCRVARGLFGDGVEVGADEAAAVPADATHGRVAAGQVLCLCDEDFVATADLGYEGGQRLLLADAQVLPFLCLQIFVLLVDSRRAVLLAGVRVCHF